MRSVAVAVLLSSFAAPAVWAQRPVTSPSGYGRILFPGGGPPTAGGRTLSPGTGVLPGSGIIGPGGGIPGRPRPIQPIQPGFQPIFGFPIAMPGQAWPTPGQPGFASYPVVDGNYYGYDPPQAQVVNNYSPSANFGTGGQQGGNASDQPVVIVNQYFRPDQAPVPQTSTAPQTTNIVPGPAAPVAVNNKADQPYFLIAMRDTTIYAASAYWIDGNTLNYVTIQGNENQVSLDLVDRELSKRLNRDRSVAFGLPAAQ